MIKYYYDFKSYAIIHKNILSMKKTCWWSEFMNHFEFGVQDNFESPMASIGRSTFSARSLGMVRTSLPANL